MRLPLGIWTDRFGGRIMMLLLLIALRVPRLAVSLRDRSTGSCLRSGCCSAWSAPRSRSARPTARVSFRRSKRGFAMGLFGAGTIGAALNMFVAPRLIEAYGWQMVPKVYAVALLVTAAMFWLVAAPDPGAGGKGGPTLRQQLAVLQGSARMEDTASTTRSSSAASPRCRSGCRNITCRSTAFDARPRCWPHASRCPAGLCARSAAGCRTASARTTSHGGCCGRPGSPVPALLSARPN